MGWWRGLVFQRGCFKEGKESKREGKEKNWGRVHGPDTLTAGCFSPLSLPNASQRFPICFVAGHATPVPVFIWHHEGFRLPQDPPTAQTLQSAHTSQLGRWQSAAEPVGRTTRLPACFALSTSPTWSGTDSALETGSLFTLTEFYDPAAMPRLVLGAWADAWICSFCTVIKPKKQLLVLDRNFTERQTG